MFERFPGLKFILTESGCAWAPDVMKHMDGMYLAWKMGAIGEIDTSNDLLAAPQLLREAQLLVRRELPESADIAGARSSARTASWGNDYPHYEGCYPYSRENMRFAFADVPEDEVRMMLGENAAALYGFDLDALRSRAEEVAITPSLVREPLDEIPADSTCITFQRARAEKAMAGAAG